MTDPIQITRGDIKDAATVMVVDQRNAVSRVLMGQRHAKLAFMPDKWVFPGGAVETQDHDASFVGEPATMEELRRDSLCAPQALIAAALRELREETGVDFGLTASDLRYLGRAITPEQRKRRFDARFFWAVMRQQAPPLPSSAGDGELTQLAWFSVEDARTKPLAFMTRLMLEELNAVLSNHPSQGIPEVWPVQNGGIIRHQNRSSNSSK